MVSLKSVFPLVQVADPAVAAAFYVKHFGFQPIFEADWYVQIRRDGFELAFIRAGHESIPAKRRGVSANVCLTFEVEDVDATYEAVKGEMDVAVTPRDEPWHQRHFLGYDPAGVMIDIVKMLPVEAQP